MVESSLPPPASSPELVVCGIAGSLRQKSYNRALLRAALELAPAGMAIRTFTQTPALLQPEILVYRAHEKFDGEGRLTDEKTRQFIGKLLTALAEWTRLLRHGPGARAHRDA